MKDAGVVLVRSRVTESLQRIEGHRFVKNAHADALSKEQTLRWIMCAGRESKSFPDILSHMLERTDDPVVTRVLRENLDDEFGNGNPEQAHFLHYIHLLSKLGLSEDVFKAYDEGPGIGLALDLAYSVSQGPDPAVALGYMLVNEGMTPITYGAVDRALHRFFPDLQTSFFIMHVEVDEHHVEELFVALAALPDSAVDDVLFGIELGERGMAALLDEALGVFDNRTDRKLADSVR